MCCFAFQGVRSVFTGKTGDRCYFRTASKGELESRRGSGLTCVGSTVWASSNLQRFSTDQCGLLSHRGLNKCVTHPSSGPAHSHLHHSNATRAAADTALILMCELMCVCACIRVVCVYVTLERTFYTLACHTEHIQFYHSHRRVKKTWSLWGQRKRRNRGKWRTV